MESYVLDNLAKYHCFDCDKEFILSEYQTENAAKKIMCPYCHGKEVQAYVFIDDEDGLLDELGCMGIGHHTDPEEEALAYQRTWGKIKEMRQKEKINSLDGREDNRC